MLEQPTNVPKDVVDYHYEMAKAKLQEDQELYFAHYLSRSSSNKFMSEIMTSGTLEDKVSAQTLVVQESPVHTIKTFESLMSLANKKSRNQALMALGALKDLLGQGVVLPPNRKLRPFNKQPDLHAFLQHRQQTELREGRITPTIPTVYLVLWAYEDWLKRTYFELLQILEQWCNDEVEFARIKAVTFVWELLKEKPEQEENLLRLLVNKLGDTANKVASRASYLLLQLQTTHPAMKSIVINAIESDVLFRPHQNLHAKYYAIITLNQTVLSSSEPEVANKLLEIYFSLFLTLLKQEDSTDPKTDRNVQGGGGKAGRKARQKARLEESARQAEDQLKERLIAQILTGVNRAFPYANTDDATFEKHMDTIFRITHSANFNTAVQALMLIQQISASKQYAAERYYRTLYESLLDPRLVHSSKQIMYLNLLYRSLKNDISLKRITAFIKRLLQIITLHEPPFVCGVLYLINELQKTTPSIRAMISEPEVDAESGYEIFHDVDDEGNSSTKPDAPAPAKPAYDPRKRDPEHSNADRTCLWELLPLQLHFHPTVSLYATRLLRQEKFTEGTPDPTLHSLIHFLDRFAYRSPRLKDAKPRGASIMQPLAGAATADMLVRESGKGRAEEPLNIEGFWGKKREDVREDEVFFHQYFEQAGKRKSRAEKRAKKKKAKAEDGESGTDEEEEEEIWKALVKSRPEVEGGADEDEEDSEELEALEELMEDDDEGEEVDGGVEFHDAPDSEGEGDAVANGAEDESDGVFDAAELEDGEDAFVGSDEELPSDLEATLDGNMASKAGKAGKASIESKTNQGEDRKTKRRKLKSLPIFASAEDYAQFLSDDGEE